MEMPDVRFDDIVTIPVDPSIKATRLHLRQKLDPLFLEVCEPGTIVPIGWNAEGTAACGGAKIEDDTIIVDLILAPNYPLPINVYVKISGVRRGYLNYRFNLHSDEQLRRNEEFWQRAIYG